MRQKVAHPTINEVKLVAEEGGYLVLLKELPSFDTMDGITWAVPEVGENRKWVNSPPVDIGIPLVYLTMES
jgi:hypothetical protein